MDPCTSNSIQLTLFVSIININKINSEVKKWILCRGKHYMEALACSMILNCLVSYSMAQHLKHQAVLSPWFWNGRHLLHSIIYMMILYKFNNSILKDIWLCIWVHFKIVVEHKMLANQNVLLISFKLGVDVCQLCLQIFTVTFILDSQSYCRLLKVYIP